MAPRLAPSDSAPRFIITGVFDGDVLHAEAELMRREFLALIDRHAMVMRHLRSARRLLVEAIRVENSMF